MIRLSKQFKRLQRRLGKGRTNLKYKLAKKRNQRRAIYVGCGLLITGLLIGLIVLNSHTQAVERQYKAKIYQTTVKEKKLLEERQNLQEQKSLTEQQVKERDAKLIENQKQIDELWKRVHSQESPRIAAKPTVAYARLSFSPGNTYTRYSCTWGVKNKRPDIPNSWGNASQWFIRAQAMGWPTGYTPKAGAIGQRSNHVVYVLAVLPGGQIKIWEQNYDYNGSIRTKVDSASRYRYIY